ncbi:Serine/threonine-protein kinase PrkC [Bienertia sinuspersici]
MANNLLLLQAASLAHDNGNSMLSFRYRMSTKSNTRDLNTCKFVPKSVKYVLINFKVKDPFFPMKQVQPLLAMSRGGDYGLKFDDESDEDPFWICFMKDIIRALKIIVCFPCSTTRAVEVHRSGQVSRIRCCFSILCSMDNLLDGWMSVLDQLAQLDISSYAALDDFANCHLTLVLVAMLIVALSSIDSALSYLLALLMRKLLDAACLVSMPTIFKFENFDSLEGIPC